MEAIISKSGELQPLAQEFIGRGSQKGFSFSLIKRNLNICVYMKSDLESDSLKCWYEVIVVRVQKENTFKIGGVDVKFNAKELYPNDELFGLYGWCFSDAESALIKLDELSNRPNNSDSSPQQ